MFKEPEAPHPALATQLHFAFPMFLSRKVISGERGSRNPLRHPHARVGWEDAPQPPHPGICPSRGDQAALPAKASWISQILQLLVQGSARLPPKYAAVQINGGSRCLAKLAVSWAVFPRDLPTCVVPRPRAQKPGGCWASIAASPELTPGRAGPGRALRRRPPDPSILASPCREAAARQTPRRDAAGLLPRPNNRFFRGNRAPPDHNLGTAD